ncbi:hypothetical protein RHIZ404_210504 [Rhizobium sp. EC-SD404]|nr:hypothetical protein RHIZ404_210504 [Rhizobium sp. EC-SD404]
MPFPLAKPFPEKSAPSCTIIAECPLLNTEAPGGDCCEVALPAVSDTNPESKMASESRFRFDPVTRTIHILGRRIRLPQSRAARIALGIALIFGGIFSFLPILGIWMLPLGLLVLSQDFAFVRRWRRSGSVYYGRRWGRKPKVPPGHDHAEH